MPELMNPNPLAALSGQIQRLVDGAGGAIVGVRSHGRSVASGFAWKPGVVVTASDALEADDDISIVAGDKTVEAKLAGRDPTTDIAVLCVSDSLPASAAPLTPSPEAAVGQMVVAVGRGKDGVIAALGCIAVTGGAWQSRRGGSIDRLIRLDLRLHRHAEGGLVLDAEGRALGMPVFGPRQRPLIIPLATIDLIAPKLLADGRIRRGYLGVGLHPIRLDDGVAATRGSADRRAVMVVSVAPDGPAGKAGLLLGDILLSFNGEPVSGLRNLFARLSPESVDKPAELTLLRGGQVTSAKLTIGASPAS
jgi:S1-C subfamily serine protease